MILLIHQPLSLLLSLIVARLWYSSYISHCHGCYRWLWLGYDIPHTPVIVMAAIVDCGKVLIVLIHQSLSWLLSLIVARFWYSPYISHCHGHIVDCSFSWYSPYISNCHGCYRWLWQSPDITHTAVISMAAIVDCGKVLIFPIHQSLS